jgi:hypothetical protein
MESSSSDECPMRNACTAVILAVIFGFPSLRGIESTTRLDDFTGDFELGFPGNFVVDPTGALALDFAGFNGNFVVAFIRSCVVDIAFSVDFTVASFVAALSLAFAAATLAALIREGLRYTGSFSSASVVEMTG